MDTDCTSPGGPSAVQITASSVSWGPRRLCPFPAARGVYFGPLHSEALAHKELPTISFYVSHPLITARHFTGLQGTQVSDAQHLLLILSHCLLPKVTLTHGFVFSAKHIHVIWWQVFFSLPGGRTEHRRVIQMSGFIHSSSSLTVGTEPHNPEDRRSLESAYWVIELAPKLDWICGKATGSYTKSFGSMVFELWLQNLLESKSYLKVQ